jgi:hypothetical protein
VEELLWKWKAGADKADEHDGLDLSSCIPKGDSSTWWDDCICGDAPRPAVPRFIDLQYDVHDDWLLLITARLPDCFPPRPGQNIGPGRVNERTLW